MKTALVLALMAALPSTVWAVDDVATARKLFQSGTKHFDLGEYEQALGDFKEAYRIKDDPVLLYNVAQCHRMLKHNEEALRAYRTFLSRSPDPQYRADVEQKIAALQEAIDKQNKASTLPPREVIPSHANDSGAAATTPPPAAAASSDAALVASAPRPKPVYKRWWFWTAIGGVAAVGLGVGLGVGLTRSANDRFFPTVTY
jgi:tetratricopeptide (TPR) repeat protein